MSIKLVKIYSRTCQPCKMLTDYLNHRGVAFEEMEATQEVIDKYNVTGVPVLLVLDNNGNVVDRAVGFRPSDTKNVDELLAKYNF